MATKKKLLEAAAGSAGGAGGLNIEDVFSTYLYEGNGSTNTITNGIDLATEGGLVWLKSREDTKSHFLYDTERGASSGHLTTNATYAQYGVASGLSAFNSNGFSLAAWNDMNGSGIDFASWTFRKAPKFFDVVTYTGDGTAGRTISHNLGSVPGMIIVKSTSNTYDWVVYHRGMDATAPEDYFLRLNTTAARSDTVTRWNDTAPTSTEFTVGDSLQVNGGSGQTYVAYLFAHNDGDGEFGPTGDQDIIKCGSYSGNSTVGHTIDLGFEAQWVLVRSTSNLRKWMLYDAMRGMPVDGNGAALYPNSTDDEEALQRIGASNVGFQLTSTDSMVNLSGETYIYIAIRRGPMAVPEDAADVFAMDTLGGTSPTPPGWNSGFPVDMGIYRLRTSTSNFILNSRLNQGKRLMTNATDAESGESAAQFDYMNGYYNATSANSNYISWMWKRAPSYFDVVAYTGNGTAGRTVSHNLGVVPEMIWIKDRDGTNDWIVYHSGVSNSYGRITTAAFTSSNVGYYFGNNDQTLVSPTDSVFTIGGTGAVNWSGRDFIAYLFASLDGVSKVGSYTGNGSATGPTIDCGFSAGPRFVLIKRSDGEGQWWVFDTERGLTSGNDPYMFLNLTSASQDGYDLIDPTSSGFQIVTNEVQLNASGGTYIFYAIA